MKNRHSNNLPIPPKQNSGNPAKPFCIVTKDGKMVSGDILENYSIKSDSKGLVQDVFGSDYGEAGIQMPPYNPDTLIRLPEYNVFHSAACKVKAWDIAGLGYVLKPVEGQEGQPDEEPLKSQHIVVDAFFKRCDPLTLYSAMLNYEQAGNCAIEIVREDPSDPHSPPDQLVNLPAHTIRVHRDRKKFLQRRDVRVRWFKAAGYQQDIHMDTGNEAALGALGANAASEIMWFVNYTPRSDYYGIPDIIPAIGAIHGDMSRRDYNIAFFRNFGVPAYAVYISGNFDPGECDEHGKSDLQTAIENHFIELQRNPHSVMVLAVPTGGRAGDVSIEFKPLAVETKEASFRLYRADNRDEVIAAHRVPPYRLGISETGSLGGGTAAESTEIYKTSVIEPRQQVLEAAINKYILWPSPEEGGFGATGWKFEFADIDNADETHDADLLCKLFDKGAVSPNDIIRSFSKRFSLQPIDHPAMDAHYVGGQPIDLDYLPDPVPPEVNTVLRSLQDKLLTIAAKSAAQQGSASEKRIPRLSLQPAGDQPGTKAILERG